MKVLQILGHTTGGIGSYVKALTQDLCAKGEKVHVLCPQEVAEVFDFKNYSAVWPSFGFSYKKFRSFVKALVTFRGIIALSDVVHVHGNQAAFFALLVCSKTDRRKIIVTLHNKIILSGFKAVLSKFTRKIVAKRCHVLSAVSSDLLEECEKYGVEAPFLAPIFAPRVIALLAQEDLSLADRQTNFVNLVESMDQKDKVFFDTSKPLVLSIARIAPQKAVDDIVRIANSGVEANFVVIGDGDNHLLDELKKADIGNKVFFAGRRDNIEEFLSAATVMLLTSKWEGCPLSLQESMAVGLPIISTFGGGIPDLIYDTDKGLQAGILCDVGDWENMSLSLQTLLEDEYLWRDYSSMARTIASTWKNNEEIAEFWQKIYTDFSY